MYRNSLEPALCELFEEVLGVGNVDPQRSFLSLGGHSLLVARLISRARTVLGAELEFADVFHAPSAADLSEVIAHRRGSPRSMPLPAHRPARLPASGTQRRLWREYLASGRPDLHVPCATRISGELNLPALEQALGDLTTRHESLRTVFEEAAGQPQQRVLAAESARPRLTVADTTEDDLRGALAAATARPFDLGADPPIRACLYRLTLYESVLLLVMHRIAFDGRSGNPLVRDLAAAYTARCQDSPPGWAPLSAQYADYAIWHEQDLGPEHDHESRRHQQLHYWRRALDGAPGRLGLSLGEPADQAGTSAAGDAGQVTFRLSASTGRRLADLARQNQVTLFMVIHAAIAALLTRCGAGTDIAVETVAARRAGDGLDDLVGNFASPLILRTDTSGDPTFGELLRRVRETDVAAYDHQDIPFDQMAAALAAGDQPATSPLPNIRLLIEDSGQGTLQLTGTRTTPEPVIAGQPAGTDLAFTFRTGHG